MPNILKARCKHCGFRATIIRTNPDPTGVTLLEARCDNRTCRAEFRFALTLLSEIRPPLAPRTCKRLPPCLELL